MPESLILHNFQKFAPKIEKLSRGLKENNIVKRIWAKDYTVWNDDPNEISSRLGWLDSPERMESRISEIMEFAKNLNSDRISDVLLMGMGGSSLAAEFFGSVKVKDKPRFRLRVINSTHPGVVKKYYENLDPSKTLYIASTKSGGTVETISLLKFFYNSTLDRLGKENTGNRFVAITDPGSGLEKIARENRFREIFLGDPEVGGRFSALSYFGLVPAALSGWDISLLLERARMMSVECKREENNPGFSLGALLGCLALEGVNKLLVSLPGRFEMFGAWIEQLVAESTGKDGKGILPIISGYIEKSPIYADGAYLVNLKIRGDNTHDGALGKSAQSGIPLVRIDLDDIYDFGGQFFLWGFATAVAGHILGINPFNQPDVESAKSAAREMVSSYKYEGKLPEPESITIEKNIDLYEPYSGNTLDSVLERFIAKAKSVTGSYISIQAYLDPIEKVKDLLDELKAKIEGKSKLPVTLGFGPGYLHSTGQLHKGDSGSGFFIQLMENYEPGLIIPDNLGSQEGSITFGTLIKAQCIGDRKALLQAQRNVLSIRFNADTIKGLERLISIF
ncbi:MAG: hypothetical protein JSW64_05660 [Candidatus Zixiibacteriota bacterium]|nr:MAG: hypothetical protein JSW64_05660 [candidate division Zixibacteria bacterium]